MSTARSPALESIIGNDPSLHRVLARAAAVAPSALPVLVTGESGTGKELLTRALHELGSSPGGPFVTVNCGALTRALAESELFGHERGAFTGAGMRRVGWFEEASGGTLVLDEVGELPIDLQPKLLRVLETGCIRRVGGSGEIALRVRVVASTLRDLAADTRSGSFRLDLYHRLAGIELRLPPLRHRPGDVAMLAGHFLREAVAEVGPRELGPAAIAALESYAWPGNVRELRNVMRRAALLCDSIVDAVSLDLFHGQTGPAPIEAPGAAAAPRLADAPSFDARQIGDDVVAIAGKTLAEIERDVYEKTLRRTRGNRRAAARALRVSRSTFCDRARRFGLAQGDDLRGLRAPG